jgi:phenylpropionate dioxygenase-like ring-hydroxylating dioxygenase large terminal subunit
MIRQSTSETGRMTYLQNLWYVLMPSRRLKSEDHIRQELFDRDIVLWRALDGRPRLTTADSIGAEISPAEIPCREQQGLIWVYCGVHAALGPTELPFSSSALPQIVESVDLPCDFDNAVYGLLDPAHVPYVHRSKWWKPRHRLREKTKTYVPHPHGFTMVGHSATQGEWSYRLLGKNAATEIDFELPGLRVEKIRGARGSVCSVTSLLPLSQNKTRMTHCLYWTMGGLAPLKPMIRYLTISFIKEDQNILTLQQDGLRHSPKQILIDDADKLMKWYLLLKKAWLASLESGQPFVNPVKGETLRWRT